MTSSATGAPLRSISVFVATVVPWTKYEISFVARPARANESKTARDGSVGVDRAFAIRSSPRTSSYATISVKVPPVSTPARNAIWPSPSCSRYLSGVRPVFQPRGHEPRQQHWDPPGLAPLRFRRLLTPHTSLHDVRAQVADRLRREPRVALVDKAAAAPLVVEAEREARENFPAEDGRADAVAAPADAVENVLPPAESAKQRQTVCRAVDRPDPVVDEGTSTRFGYTRRKSAPTAGLVRGLRSKRSPIRPAKAICNPPFPNTIRPSRVVR